MAEIYSPGLQRIFYRASSFREGQYVTVTIFNVELEKKVDNIVLTETTIIKGLYYFDYFFDEGIYIACFRENMEEKKVQVYNIEKSLEVGRFRTSPGHNVINL